MGWNLSFSPLASELISPANITASIKAPKGELPGWQMPGGAGRVACLESAWEFYTLSPTLYPVFLFHLAVLSCILYNEPVTISEALLSSVSGFSKLWNLRRGVAGTLKFIPGQSEVWLAAWDLQLASEVGADLEHRARNS